METGALVMAEFYADWCPHCQKMMPIVKEFKELEKGKLEVVQINIEEESALADLYTVESIPTFILLRKGEALWRQSGEMNLDRLRKVVEDVVELIGLVYPISSTLRLMNWLKASPFSIPFPNKARSIN